MASIITMTLFNDQPTDFARYPGLVKALRQSLDLTDPCTVAHRQQPAPAQGAAPATTPAPATPAATRTPASEAQGGGASR